MRSIGRFVHDGVRASVWLGLWLCAACTCGGGPADPTDDDRVAEPVEWTAADLFPLGLGDRWGYRQTGGPEETFVRRSITGIDDGVAVRFGSDHTQASRFRAEVDGSVLMVSPAGEALGVWLAEPVELGGQWTYELGDTSCRARYAAVGEEIEVAGVRFEGCVEVERACRFPEGKPMPVEAIETVRELYCVGVGLMRERSRWASADEGHADALEGFVPAALTLDYYRVAGAPAPPLPETLACEDVLLLESDVRAACGASFHETQRARVDGACRFRFAAGPDAAVLADRTAVDIEIRQADVPYGEAALDALIGEGRRIDTRGDLRVASAEIATGAFIEPQPPGPEADSADRIEYRHQETAPLAFGFAEGKIAVVVRVENEGCSFDHARRLEALFRSLFRQ